MKAKHVSLRTVEEREGTREKAKKKTQTHHVTPLIPLAKLSIMASLFHPSRPTRKQKFFPVRRTRDAKIAGMQDTGTTEHVGKRGWGGAAFFCLSISRYALKREQYLQHAVLPLVVLLPQMQRSAHALSSSSSFFSRCALLHTAQLRLAGVRLLRPHRVNSAPTTHKRTRKKRETSAEQ